MVERIITGELGVNTYLYNYNKNRIVIIDPGNDFEAIEEYIKNRGFEPKAVILTHGHFDHIGSLKKVKERYRIPVYIHIDDSKYIGPESINIHSQMLLGMGIAESYIQYYIGSTPKPDYLLSDNERLEEFDLEVIHTPGHSEGSICLYSSKKEILFSGDTLFRGSYGRTDFPGGNFNDLKKSIKRVLTLPDTVVVYPGHGSETYIGEEKGVTQLY